MTKRARKNLDRREKFVMLPKWLLTCPAWKALPLAAKVLYIEGLELRYNGCNNGDIRLSQIEAASVIGSTGRGACTHQHAGKMLERLIDHGFIRPVVKGRFHVKVRFATRWLLTRYEREGSKPTVDFMRWQAIDKQGIVSQPIDNKQPAEKFKQRVLPEYQTCAPRTPDGPDERQSGAPRTPDSALSAPATCAPRTQVLVYQGGRSAAPMPRGTQRAKAEWLREHLAAGVLNVSEVENALAIRPDDVGAIAAGKIAIGNPSWEKLAALVASRMN